jgi:hypothetical protein
MASFHGCACETADIKDTITKSVACIKNLFKYANAHVKDAYAAFNTYTIWRECVFSTMSAHLNARADGIRRNKKAALGSRGLYRSECHLAAFYFISSYLCVFDLHDTSAPQISDTMSQNEKPHGIRWSLL